MVTKMTMPYEAMIMRWADDRGITQNSDPKTQCLKFISEAGELADNIAKGRYDAARDDLGDIIVTLLILCDLIDVNLTSCIAQAYEEISKRQGRMVNGVFVKDGDVA